MNCFIIDSNNSRNEKENNPPEIRRLNSLEENQVLDQLH